MVMMRTTVSLLVHFFLILSTVHGSDKDFTKDGKYEEKFITLDSESCIGITSIEAMVLPKANGYQRTVQDVVDEVDCSLQSVRGLSRQITAQVLCDNCQNLSEDCLVRFAPSGNMVFNRAQPSDVLALLTPDAMEDLYRAARDQPDRIMNVRGAFWTIVDKIVAEANGDADGQPFPNCHVKFEHRETFSAEFSKGIALHISAGHLWKTSMAKFNFGATGNSNIFIHTSQPKIDIGETAQLRAFAKLKERNHEKASATILKAPADGFDVGPSCTNFNSMIYGSNSRVVKISLSKPPQQQRAMIWVAPGYSSNIEEKVRERLKDKDKAIDDGIEFPINSKLNLRTDTSMVVHMDFPDSVGSNSKKPTHFVYVLVNPDTRKALTDCTHPIGVAIVSRKPPTASESVIYPNPVYSYKFLPPWDITAEKYPKTCTSDYSKFSGRCTPNLECPGAMFNPNTDGVNCNAGKGNLPYLNSERCCVRDSTPVFITPPAFFSLSRKRYLSAYGVSRHSSSRRDIGVWFYNNALNSVGWTEEVRNAGLRGMCDITSNFIAVTAFEKGNERLDEEWRLGGGYGNKYRGRGAIQLTWEINYQAAAEYARKYPDKYGELSVIHDQPEYVAFPRIGMIASVFFWQIALSASNSGTVLNTNPGAISRAILDSSDGETGHRRASNLVNRGVDSARLKPNAWSLRRARWVKANRILRCESISRNLKLGPRVTELPATSAKTPKPLRHGEFKLEFELKYAATYPTTSNLSREEMEHTISRGIQDTAYNYFVETLPEFVFTVVRQPSCTSLFGDYHYKCVVEVTRSSLTFVEMVKPGSFQHFLGFRALVGENSRPPVGSLNVTATWRNQPKKPKDDATYTYLSAKVGLVPDIRISRTGNEVSIRYAMEAHVLNFSSIIGPGIPPNPIAPYISKMSTFDSQIDGELKFQAIDSLFSSTDVVQILPRLHFLSAVIHSFSGTGAGIFVIGSKLHFVRDVILEKTEFHQWRVKPGYPKSNTNIEHGKYALSFSDEEGTMLDGSSPYSFDQRDNFVAGAALVIQTELRALTNWELRFEAYKKEGNWGKVQLGFSLQTIDVMPRIFAAAQLFQPGTKNGCLVKIEGKYPLFVQQGRLLTDEFVFSFVEVETMVSNLVNQLYRYRAIQSMFQSPIEPFVPEVAVSLPSFQGRLAYSNLCLNTKRDENEHWILGFFFLNRTEGYRLGDDYFSPQQAIAVGEGFESRPGQTDLEISAIGTYADLTQSVQNSWDHDQNPIGDETLFFRTKQLNDRTKRMTFDLDYKGAGWCIAEKVFHYPEVQEPANDMGNRAATMVRRDISESLICCADNDCCSPSSFESEKKCVFFPGGYQYFPQPYRSGCYDAYFGGLLFTHLDWPKMGMASPSDYVEHSELYSPVIFKKSVLGKQQSIIFGEDFSDPNFYLNGRLIDLTKEQGLIINFQIPPEFHTGNGPQLVGGLFWPFPHRLLEHTIEIEYGGAKPGLLSVVAVGYFWDDTQTASPPIDGFQNGFSLMVHSAKRKHSAKLKARTCRTPSTRQQRPP